MARHTSARSATSDVVSWRARCLRGAGFGRALAKRVAADPGFGLHALIDLAERGCPPELAVRILAPLDEEEEKPSRPVGAA